MTARCPCACATVSRGCGRRTCEQHGQQKACCRLGPCVRSWPMTPTRQGSFRLFRFAGIDVYVHWSWFLIAVYGISIRTGGYSSMAWPVLEYLALFLIVLMHEFGHALACRQVGGQADQIVLWPLGGVAYVAPPPRPGATLWSISAGPLVNVALAPVFSVLWWLGYSLGWAEATPNVYAFLKAVCIMNWALLIFNMLPIYPRSEERRVGQERRS